MAHSDYSEQVSKLIAKINEKNPHYIIAGILALILVVDYFGVMQFQIGTLSSLNPKIRDLSQEVKATKSNIQRMPQYQKEVRDLEQRIADINDKMKPRAGVPLILENISRVASKNGVQVEQLMPDTAVDQPVAKNKDGFFYKIPIVVEARSGYHQFGRFLNELEREEVFLSIPEFTIAAAGNEAAQHAIKLTIHAIVFDKIHE